MGRSKAVGYVGCLAFNSSVAGLGNLILPLAIGTLAQAGLNAKALGILASAEVAGGALAALVASTRIQSVRPLILCLVGCIMAAIGNFASAAFSHSFAALLLCRPIAGIGCALISAGGLALVAGLRRPERVYGYVAMAPCLSALVAFTLAPVLIQRAGGAAGLFALQGALALVDLVLIASSRRLLETYRDADGPLEPETVAAGAAAPVGGPVGLPTRLMAFAATFLIAICDISVWAFAAPVGAHAGLPLDQISRVFTICSLIGVFGPLLAARMGLRLGIAGPVTAAMAVMIVTSVVMVATVDPLVYQLALFARVFAILFTQPLYQGLFARIDHSGALVAATTGTSQLGYTVGPMVAGMVISIEAQDFHNLATIAVGSAVLAVLLTYLILGRERQMIRRAPAKVMVRPH